MEEDALEALASTVGAGDRSGRGELLSLIAKDVYARPRIYGLRSEEDVGELFEEYWIRIAGLVDRYRDVGASFRAYLVSSLRFMALSIRKRRARQADHEAVFAAELRAEYGRSIDAEAGSIDAEPTGSDARAAESRQAGGLELPAMEDVGQAAAAFRRRLVYLCVKCSNTLDDHKASTIARKVGIDEGYVLSLMRGARDKGLGIRGRTAARRRGRDAAWLRILVNQRRLERETDPYKRRALSEAIERDRAMHGRIVRRIAKSAPVVSNKGVADYLGVPKGTVDCGVGRMVRRFETAGPEIDD